MRDWKLKPWVKITLIMLILLILAVIISFTVIKDQKSEINSTIQEKVNTTMQSEEKTSINKTEDKINQTPAEVKFFSCDIINTSIIAKYTQEIMNVEKNNQTKTFYGPSLYENAEVENKNIVYLTNTTMEDHCQIKGEDQSFKIRFICGDPKQVSKKYEEEKTKGRVIEKGKAGKESWIGRKTEILYSGLFINENCFIDLPEIRPEALDTKLGDELLTDLEKKI